MKSNLSFTWRDALSFLLLLLLTLVYFWRVPLQGKVLLPLDVLYTYEPWRSEIPGALGLNVWNSWPSDAVRQYYPLQSIVQNAWQYGEIPFWNPYALNGMPVLAAGFYQALYPITIVLLLLMPVAQAMTWQTIVHTFLGSLFMYLFVRELGSGSFGALLGALAFSYNGYLVSWLATASALGTIIWLPLIFFCFERACRRHDWRWAIAGSGALLMQILAGHIQMVFYTLLGLGLYAVYRAGLIGFEQRCWRTAALPLLQVGLLLAFGLGLAAVQWLPTLELLPHGVRGAYDLDAINTDFSLWVLLRLLIPDALGTDIDGNFSPAFTHEVYVYFGLLPLLCLAASLVSPYRRLAWGLFGFGLIVWMVIFRVPPIVQIFETAVPSLTVLGFHRAQFLIVFFWAAAAGLGADWLVSQRPVRTLGYLVAGGAVVALIMVGYSLYLVFISKFQARFAWPIPAIDDLERTVYLLSSVLLAVALLAAVGTALSLWRGSRLSAAVFSTLAISLLVIDLFLAHLDYVLPFAPDKVFPLTPSLNALKQSVAAEAQQPVRLMSVNRLLWGDMATVFRLADVQGYDSFLMTRYSHYVDLTGARADANFRIAAFEAETNKFLDALNVKYIYAPRDKLADGDWISLLTQLDRPLVESLHSYAGQTDEWIIAGWPQPVLLAPTSSKISYRGKLAYPTQLETALAIEPTAWQQLTTPVQFELYIEPTIGGERQLLFSKTLSPLSDPSKMTWQPVVVDLSAYTGQDVTVTFVTAAEDGATWNVGWADPLLMDNSKVELLHYGPNSIYRNKNGLPRAWIVYDVQEVVPHDLNAARQLMLDPAFDPARQAVIEGNLPSNWVTPPDEVDPTGTATFLEYTPTRIVIQSDSRQSGLLVLSDIFYPGWEVYVDGAPQLLYAANLAMRATPLLAGMHTVEFVYAPLSFKIGLLISVVSLATVVLVLSVNQISNRDVR